MKLPKIKNLVLSGGGIKGLAICGALDKLDQEIKLLSSIKTIIGSSIGAFIGFFLCIGLTTKKIKIFFDSFNFNEYQDADIKLFLSKFGLDDGNKFFSLIKATMITQGFDPNITFVEFSEKSRYNLVVVGTNVNLSEACYFSKDTTPDMQLWKALRISCGYPIAFTPVELNGDLYADGGIVCPLPSDLFSKKDINKTLGIAIHRSIKRYNTDTVFNYLFGVISCILDSLLDKNISKLKYVIKLSYPVNSMDIGIGEKDKQELFDCGVEGASVWFSSFKN